MIALTELAQDATTVTFGWVPVPGAVGYEFLVDGKRVSNTWDPAAKQIRFAKPAGGGSHVYGVVALVQGDQGAITWPAASGWVVAPPQPPTKTITNPSGIGVNVTQANSQIHDTIVQGGNDSAFICEPTSPGSVIQRCQAFNVAGGPNPVGYGKHAVYAKAKNLTVADFTATGSANAADGLSVRYSGFLGQRCQVDGFEFALAVFADDPTGPVTWRQMKGSSRNAQTAIWLDVQDSPQNGYDYTIDDVHLTGPGWLFLRANAAVFKGTVTIKGGCTYNGSPVTAQMIQNVPASALKILP